MWIPPDPRRAGQSRVGLSMRCTGAEERGVEPIQGQGPGGLRFRAKGPAFLSPGHRPGLRSQGIGHPNGGRSGVAGKSPVSRPFRPPGARRRKPGPMGRAEGWCTVGAAKRSARTLRRSERCEGAVRRSGAEERCGGAVRRSGAEERCGGAVRRSGAKERCEGAVRRSGAKERCGGAVRKSGAASGFRAKGPAFLSPGHRPGLRNQGIGHPNGGRS